MFLHEPSVLPLALLGKEMFEAEICAVGQKLRQPMDIEGGGAHILENIGDLAGLLYRTVWRDAYTALLLRSHDKELVSVVLVYREEIMPLSAKAPRNGEYKVSRLRKALSQLVEPHRL